MRFDASIGFLVFLVILALYRLLLMSNKVQLFLHRGHRSKIAWLFQWYTLYIIGVISYMVFSLHELLKDPGYDNIEKDVIEDKLREWFKQDMDNNYTSTSFSNFKKSFKVSDWLRYTNLVSQATGIPVCIIASYHIAKLLVIPGKRLALEHEDYQNYPWKPPPRLNWLLLVVSMPTMFSVMSMRATCRLWAVFTGTVDLPAKYSTGGLKDVEFASEALDLELAALFQFSTVYAFARICGSMLTEAAFFHQDGDPETKVRSHEYSRTIRFAAFLCVWSFVVVGAVRCLLNVAFAEVEQTIAMNNATNPERVDRLLLWQQVIQTLYQNFQDSISLLFSALTVLCVLNMFFICRMAMIKKKLGNANLKFTGTRLLILALEIQGKLINCFTVDSSLYTTAQKFKDELPDWFPLKRWAFFKMQAHLFNLSLLNIECLIVVVLNVQTWRTLDLEKSGIMRFKKDWEQREHNRKTFAEEGNSRIRLLATLQESDDDSEPK